MVTWRARAIRHPTIIMSVPSWVSQKPFCRVWVMLRSLPFSFTEMERVDLLSFKPQLWHTEWLEGKSYYCSGCLGGAWGCSWLGFLLCPKLPWTLPQLFKKRKKDESFFRVRNGHCYTCWARGNCLSSFCYERNGLIYNW